jgi:N-glycosidase YbiA
MNKAISHFRGPHRWLSNFWPAKVTLDGMEFSTVEHGYQAAKTLDMAVRAQIAVLPTPGEAKRMGRKLEVREGWDGMKLKVMEDLLLQKFADADLRQKLLDTGDAYLEEQNTWEDFFWGVCDGKGENHLGKLLMATRNDLRSKGDALPLPTTSGGPQS